MKIALFSPNVFSLTLGATKNRLEFANALSDLGWEYSLVDTSKLGLPSKFTRTEYADKLKDYLINHGADFDVVLYEYNTLPFDRSLFSAKTLFIARPALLHYNYEFISVPYDLKTRIKQKVKALLTFASHEKKKRELFRAGVLGLKNADLIQVQSQKDKETLLKKGYSSESILIVPNGISDERIKLFENSYISTIPDRVIICFIGTFDYRKGAIDFPVIFEKVKKEFPSAKLRLLGTKGLFSSEQVLAFFPKRFRNDIEVIEKFVPDELPGLLGECSLGIFPSYHESFGFGALEMMAAGLPVVSYNVPGPSDFCISDLLVEIGDKDGMTEKILLLLKDHKVLSNYKSLAREVLKSYSWKRIAKAASEEYKKKIS